MNKCNYVKILNTEINFFKRNTQHKTYFKWYLEIKYIIKIKNILDYQFWY
jgi:hypothetical protein